MALGDEVKHPNEVACDARRLGGRQSQRSDGDVVFILCSSSGPSDRVTTDALTPLNPPPIMGRFTRAARPCGKGQREPHRVWPSVFGTRDPEFLPTIRR